MEIKRSGVHVNAENEIIGWVKAGTSVEMQDGDKVLSSASQAKKADQEEAYLRLKAENTRAKGTGTPRTPVPMEGEYTVVKSGFGGDTDGERDKVAHLLLSNSDFASFWAKAPKTFVHTNRKGEERVFETKGFVAYAIRRGMIATA